ncbi:uncharacterized [Tachysurus ichikawai]
MSVNSHMIHLLYTHYTEIKKKTTAQKSQIFTFCSEQRMSLFTRLHGNKNIRYLEHGAEPKGGVESGGVCKCFKAPEIKDGVT